MNVELIDDKNRKTNNNAKKKTTDEDNRRRSFRRKFHGINPLITTLAAVVGLLVGRLAKP